jgi:subtilisin family serine protease
MQKRLFFILTLAFLLIPALQVDAQPPSPADKTDASALDSALRDAIAVAAPSAAQIATEQALGIWAGPYHVRLMLEAEQLPQLPAGVVVEASRSGLHQLRVPRDQVETVAKLPGVQRLRPPLPHHPALFSEGLTPGNFWQWHASNWTGSGVKIAIIDTGFTDWRDLQSQGELPSFVSIRNFRADGQFETSEHGSAVAEIVYDTAPGADIHLYAFDTEIELASAANYARSQGIDIIVHSVSWFNTGPGNGTGVIADIVRTATASGILWVNSAGNQAQRHYGGFFILGDNGRHLFAPGDDRNDVFASANETICGFLSWDSWPTTSDDYDLWLYRGNQWVAKSDGVQNGTQPPTEAFCYTTPVTDTYSFRITRYSGQARNLTLHTLAHNLEHNTVTGSIVQPADASETFSVGAIFFDPQYNYPLEPFSSQGPTSDGRLKPDLVAYDGISTRTYGDSNWLPFEGGGSGFFGTSAAAPHVAGAAAVVMQRYPDWNDSQVRGFLAIYTFRARVQARI